MTDISSLLTSTDKLISERQKTHGLFAEQARLAQALKDIFRCAPNWVLLSPAQREGLDMNANKVARILAGDPSFKDHWQDISGYAECVLRELNHGKL
jgi:hypothetical protein